ncbi:ATP phosphoribosyltransferase regulatory subunit [Alicyclobacillus fastidiosus]|uniref:ATP phosphoribosyltransferase regulatory subunit n=1 Tax=Alicyclobacillus fastidiosus TaxID=392011 RepID=A0ABV5ADD0_9BACL|nr:ATP phosphoribosyltransferase regulatory subunit [Alicyclobacillus fastidiosus]WEH08698.1 ATP phosphoribosyltransferase regulatory subunit [Alicyclobacillus fastidiosus]
MSVNVPSGFADRPIGMQDSYPGFAKRRRVIENRLVDFFDDSGYELVSSGAFEFVDTLLRARPLEAAREWVQLFDGTGNTIALRPEMTPSIARMAAPLVTASKLPIRWCYAERVYRRTNDPASLSWASGKAAESTQVGVEWIGVGGTQADAEVLSLCHRATQALGLADTQTVVSHAMLVPALLEAVGVPAELVSNCLDCLTRGDYVAFHAALPDDVPNVLGVLQSITPYQPESLQEELLGARWQSEDARFEMMNAWSSLVELAETVTNMDLQEHVTFDLTLHRDITYYTGLVFEVFAPGVGAPIALGGRYDDLLAQFGSAAPAVGMAFEIERVLAVLNPPTGHTTASIPGAATADGSEGSQNEPAGKGFAGGGLSC